MEAGVWMGTDTFKNVDTFEYRCRRTCVCVPACVPACVCVCACVCACVCVKPFWITRRTEHRRAVFLFIRSLQPSLGLLCAALT